MRESDASTDRAEREALLVLRLLPGVGDRRLSRLLDDRGSALRVLALADRPFAAAAGSAALQARSDLEIQRAAARLVDRCEELEIRIIGLGDRRYPRSLTALVDPPAVIFLRGEAPLPGPRSVAVVGSRRATPVGRRTAERIGRDLSEAGVTVLSGMAFGIDAAAHRGALSGPGGTIAVLGSGPDRAYPRSHRDLFRRIVEEGLVVSEFPPGEPAQPFNFPRRNRVLAALSRAVVVVEAAKRSGALITTDHAMDLGLEIFAVPGSIETPQAVGSNALIRDGAHLLTGADDLLGVMGWADARRDRDGSAAGGPDSSDHDRRRLLDALEPAPKALDELVEATGLPAGRTLALLTRLEAEGACRRDFSGWAAW